MKKRCCTTGNGCLFFMGILAILWACSPAMDSTTTPESEKMEEAMNLAYKTDTDTPTIPPIDAEMPSAFETASFGLG